MPNINLSILNQKATPSFYADTLANRPAPSFVGRIFVSTDTYDLYRDTGSAWVLLSPSAASGVTGTGAAGQVAFWNGTTEILGTNNLFWDNATGTFYIGGVLVGTGRFNVNSPNADNHIQVSGQNAPSIRVDDLPLGATKRIGIGIATANNNFIQGSLDGNMCIFNSSSVASPILFGIFNGVNTQEAGRFSAARNFLLGQTNDTGEKLQITGDAKITGTLSATTISKIGGNSTTILATDGSTISAGTGITIAAGTISSSGGGGGATIPTFTFVTTNQQNPAYYFDSYLLQYNINGDIVTGYTKTGALTINSSNFAQITSFSSDVEVLTNFQTNFQNLTSLSLPNLVAIGNQFNPGAPLITDLSAALPSLQRVGGNFSITSSFNILNLNFPQLLYVGGLSLNNNNSGVVTSISFPNLVSVGTSVNISNQSVVTTFNFDSLQNIYSSISIQNLTSLNTIAFVSLVRLNNNNNAGGLNVQGCTALFAFILPNIERIYSSGGTTINFASGTPNLTIFAFGSNLKQIGNTSGNVIFTSCALNQSSVDGILVSLAALDGTNGTTTFNNRIVTITGTSATPSATGLAAKTTLQARGCTVTNN